MFVLIHPLALLPYTQKKDEEKPIPCHSNVSECDCLFEEPLDQYLELVAVTRIVIAKSTNCSIFVIIGIVPGRCIIRPSTRSGGVVEFGRGIRVADMVE